MTEAESGPTRAERQGLMLARLGSFLAAALLVVHAILRALSDVVPGGLLLAVFYLCLAIATLLPWTVLPQKIWPWLFGAFVVGVVAFVFAMIYEVMFLHNAIAATGEKPGVPGFHGTLIFLVLMQPPVALFRRHPEALS